jgi:ERF superfamily protein
MNAPNDNLAVVEHPQATNVTPMGMLQMAVQQGADIEKLQKLMDLQERWEKNEARKAFAAAMVAFKGEPLEIMKNKRVSFETSKGRTEYDHATLHNVCVNIIEALRKHGIAHTWKTSTADGKVNVTCVLRHSMGHEETVTLDAKADDSGGKNGIQAIGSTITYLQRYSLLAATGLAVKGQDDDGNGSETKGLPPEQFQKFVDDIQNQTKKEKAKAVWQEAVKVCKQFGDVDSANRLKQILLDHSAFIDKADAV